MAIQLKLFEETTEIDILRSELADVKQKGDNVRKGMFARHSELAKLYLELSEKIDQLNASIKKQHTL